METKGSGKTAPEFIKELEERMEKTIVQELVVSSEDVFPEEYIEELKDNGIDMEDVSNEMVREVTKIMVVINAEMSKNGMFFRGKKEHLRFVFDESLKVFEEILKRQA